jgi:CHAT domain-containing protein
MKAFLCCALCCVWSTIAPAQTPARPDAEPSFEFYGQQRQMYADVGNFTKTIEVAKLQLQLAPGPAKELPVLRSLVASHATLNQFAQAREALTQMERNLKVLQTRKGWANKRDWWQALYANANATIEMRAGHLDKAEAAWKACVASAQASLQSDPEREGRSLFVDCSRGLLSVLITTGQLSAAAQVGTQLRDEAQRTMDMHARPLIMVRANQALAELAVEQGKLAQARELLQATLGLIDQTEGVGFSLRAANVREQLALIEMLQGHWEEALKWHEARVTAMEAAKEERGNKGVRTPEHAYTLVRLGRVAAAVNILRTQVRVRENLYDQNALQLWEARAFLGVALAAAGQRDEALREMREAMPRVLDIYRGERASSESGVLRTARLNWLLDGYIYLLADSARTDAWALDEAFRMADLAKGSTVQRALAASASRANFTDAGLAQLARTEQDQQRELSALAESIGNLLARGRVAEQDRVVAAMRATLAAMRSEHTKTLAEIERRYPNYSTLLSPKPVGVAAVQKLLKPSESLVSVYVGSARVLVWAIAAEGAPAFAVSDLDARQLDAGVASLRRALDPSAEATGRLPTFPFDTAHMLYRGLLAPVESVWKGAKELIVVPHGRLAQLPLGVLTTQAFQEAPGEVPYAGMAQAPWLVKQVAVSHLPAVVALPLLRTVPHTPARQAFIGFGDPVFGAEPAPQGGGSRGIGQGLVRRNLVLARGGSDSIIDFRLLPQLPDTAEEIAGVASVLAADPARDVYLGKRASEALLKKLDLSQYRVVMFATHGLMGGEMPGLFQPALALSNPAFTGETEDGLLTMEEILGLKLNAEWVVLSACNSAAAGTATEESLSGLGRAFFYAGAQSLLVTNWAVETTSARLLTTDAFRRQAGNPRLSRVQALQQSSLALMQQRAEDGFSYAHPMFWAPYSLVGDGSPPR